MMSSFLRTSKYQEKADRKAFMMENGRMLLEKLIKSCNGKYNPIRSFSADELKRATNNYHHENVITVGPRYKLHRGFLQDRPTSVMRYLDDGFIFHPNEFCFNNISFASQMSHKNVLKLVGCCLEVQVPILVFEPIEYGTLNNLLYPRDESNREPVQLKHRLKIAMEIANVITYLHIGFSRPIVFRALTPSNILLREQYMPKLFDFSLSVSIPEGQTHVRGSAFLPTVWIAPECKTTGYFNEKCDVYSFGHMLLMILTLEKLHTLVGDPGCQSHWLSYLKFAMFVKNHGINGTVDATIIGDELLEQQLRASIELAFKRFSHSPEDRPNMIEAAKQLRQMLIEGNELAL